MRSSDSASTSAVRRGGQTTFETTPYLVSSPMAKYSRRRKRHMDRSGPPPGPARETAAQTARRIMETLPLDFGDVSHVRISDLINPPAPPPKDAEQEPTGSGSRANAAKGFRRSKLLFSQAMLDAIENAYEGYAVKVRPTCALEEYMVRELARTSVIDEKCHEQLMMNDQRIAARILLGWSMDRTADAECLGEGLGESSQVVAGELSRTKYGTLYLIKQLTYLDEIITHTGGLDEPQRQAAFALLGIDEVFRNGSPRVPQGSDTAGLKAMVADELARHRANLPALNDADAVDQQMATAGIVPARDSTTRLLRADQNRARRRFDWAMKTLKELQAGVDPATLFDPDTKKPVTPGPRPTAVKERARPRGAAARSATGGGSAAGGAPGTSLASASGRAAGRSTRDVPGRRPRGSGQDGHGPGQ